EAGQPFLQGSKIQLLEVMAQGRFGSVYRGLMTGSRVNEEFSDEKDDLFKEEKDEFGEPIGRIIAVKVFLAQEKLSWKTEQEVYRLPQMRHRNILRFITAQANPKQNNEYWLVTE